MLQVFVIEGLAQNLHEVAMRHLRFEIVRQVGGDHDHGHVGVGSVEAVGKSQSVLAGHLVVDDDGVDRGEVLHRGKLAGGAVFVHHVAVVAQIVGQGGAKVVVIIKE